ncbi:MAG: aminotransferase class I/II-fold pyridoxal phosphate-dependent enzyme, partial [Marivivens sp.]|nr:aminotransferase class I/II-fold pyridoxal phosphate-dependent enzyme [Marivivens sp.]
IHRVAKDGFADQVAKLRDVYSSRRDNMLAALEREMPEGVTWTRPEGGMFVWITLPAHIDGATLLAQSLETERVAFVPGRAFFADGSNGNTIRLSFSCARPPEINEGIARLGRLIRSVA